MIVYQYNHNTTVRNTNSTSDTSEVSIGKSNTGGDQSIKIYYASGDGNLNITNYDLGDINLNLHGGTTGVDTGGFKVKYKNNVIFQSDYKGNVSIKKDDAVLMVTLLMSMESHNFQERMLLEF